jgi:hypothetical protein
MNNKNKVSRETVKQGLKLRKKELLAKNELGTYFEGLCDALEMTPEQLKKAINTILKG